MSIISKKNLFTRGIELFQKNNFSEAIEFFRQALEKDPENPSIFNYLGVSFLKVGCFYEAIICFNFAVELIEQLIEQGGEAEFNRYIVYLKNLANTYSALAKSRKNEAKTLSPSSGELKNNLLFQAIEGLERSNKIWQLLFEASK